MGCEMAQTNLVNNEEKLNEATSRQTHVYTSPTLPFSPGARKRTPTAPLLPMYSGPHPVQLVCTSHTVFAMPSSPSIDKQGYTGVDDLCDERISFLVGSVCFELGKNVGIAVVDNGLGEAGDYRMKSAVHGRSLRCIHTAQMQRQKLLESHCDDVRCSG